MADASARATGEVGVFSVVPGPGLTNALTGIGEALFDSIPIVGIITDVDRPPGTDRAGARARQYGDRPSGGQGALRGSPPSRDSRGPVRGVSSRASWRARASGRVDTLSALDRSMGLRHARATPLPRAV